MEEVPEDGKKANITPVVKKDKKDLGNYRLVNLTQIPEKVKGRVLLKNISKHMKDKKVDGNSQHEFTKEKYHYQGAKKNEVKRETESKASYLKIYIYSICTKPNWRKKTRDMGVTCSSELLPANQSSCSLFWFFLEPQSMCIL